MLDSVHIILNTKICLNTFRRGRSEIRLHDFIFLSATATKIMLLDFANLTSVQLNYAFVVDIV